VEQASSLLVGDGANPRRPTAIADETSALQYIASPTNHNEELRRNRPGEAG
jgi:hypothetical protein